MVEREHPVNKASVHFLTFSKKASIMFRSFLVTMVSLKNGMNLRQNATYMKGYMATISRLSSFIIKENYENATNSVIHDHQLIKDSRILTLDTVPSTETYYLLIPKVQNKPSSNIYFKNLFNDYKVEWTTIYMLPCLVTYNTYMQSFQ